MKYSSFNDALILVDKAYSHASSVYILSHTINIFQPQENDRVLLRSALTMAESRVK